MVSVAGSVEIGRLAIISEQHVLRMVVNQVALLVRELELGDKASDSQLLNDLEDVELGVESGASLGLELVLSILGMPAAQTPRTGEVLLAEEAPHGVFEGLAAVAHLSSQVVLELLVLLGGTWVVVTIFVLLFLNIVVELLGHRIVKAETLVGAKHVANETEAEGKVGTEPLESVGDGLTGRAS